MKDSIDLVSVRLVKDKKLYSKTNISSPEDAVKVIANEFKYFDREVFGILNLNNKNQPINLSIVSIGTINSSLVAPRETFKNAILSNAKSILLFHNHPSGNPEPSKEDIFITKRLEEAGTLLGIDVLDHIVIAPNTDKAYSIKKQDYFEIDNYVADIEDSLIVEIDDEELEI